MRAAKDRRTTPVVVFSTSDDVADIAGCYDAGCNSYVTKPIGIDGFDEAVHSMAAYWLKLSRLPNNGL